MNTKKPVNPFTAGTRKSGDLQAENREHNSARDISKHYLKYPLITASNEPSSHTCVDIWRMPRVSTTSPFWARLLTFICWCGVIG